MRSFSYKGIVYDTKKSRLLHERIFKNVSILDENGSGCFITQRWYETQNNVFFQVETRKPVGEKLNVIDRILNSLFVREEAVIEPLSRLTKIFKSKEECGGDIFNSTGDIEIINKFGLKFA